MVAGSRGARVLGEERLAGLGEHGGGLARGELLDGGDEVALAVRRGEHLEDAGRPEVFLEVDAAVALAEVLEAAPPVGRSDEGAFVAEADAGELFAGLDAHLADGGARGGGGAVDVEGADLDALEHAAVLALEQVEPAGGEERAEREEDRALAEPAVAEDGGVLAAHEGEGDLELAERDLVRPAGERVLVEALEVERALVRVDAGELVLAELPG